MIFLCNDHIQRVFIPSWVEVLTVWIFTPRLPWTVVGVVTHCQQFVNGLSTVCQRFVNSLEINMKTNTIFLKLTENNCITGIVAFRLILRGDSNIRQYPLTHISITRARLEWKFLELPTTFTQLYPQYYRVLGND